MLTSKEADFKENSLSGAILDHVKNLATAKGIQKKRDVEMMKFIHEMVRRAHTRSFLLIVRAAARLRLHFRYLRPRFCAFRRCHATLHLLIQFIVCVCVCVCVWGGGGSVCWVSVCAVERFGPKALVRLANQT